VARLLASGSLSRTMRNSKVEAAPVGDLHYWYGRLPDALISVGKFEMGT